MNEQSNIQMNERMNKQINERMNKQMIDQNRLSSEGSLLLHVAIREETD